MWKKFLLEFLRNYWIILVPKSEKAFYSEWTFSFVFQEVMEFSIPNHNLGQGKNFFKSFAF
jgi:hypothetical protein